MVGSVAVLGIGAALLIKPAPRLAAPLPRLWARLCLAALKFTCGIEVKLLNPEFLPAGPAVLAAQHQSALDIFIWLALLERPSFVYKQELAKLPLFGALLNPYGMIPVQRGGGGPALRKMAADCAAALERGRQIVIFPEGTRVPPGQRVALRSGIASLAKTGLAPVIPATTDSGLVWGKRAFQKSPGIAHVKLFPPLGSDLPQEEILPMLTGIFYEEGIGRT